MTTKQIPDAMDISTLVNPLAAAEVAAGEARDIIIKLEHKRERCVQRGRELSDEQAATAFAACTGDAKAAKRLTEIHNSLAVHSSELASFDAALRVAGDRLAAAEKTRAREVERERGIEIIGVLERLKAAGREVDDALAAMVAAGDVVHQATDELHRLDDPEQSASSFSGRTGVNDLAHANDVVARVPALAAERARKFRRPHFPMGDGDQTTLRRC
jgi:hypothetical protein